MSMQQVPEKSASLWKAFKNERDTLSHYCWHYTPSYLVELCSGLV